MPFLELARVLLFNRITSAILISDFIYKRGLISVGDMPSPQFPLMKLRSLCAPNGAQALEKEQGPCGTAAPHPITIVTPAPALLASWSLGRSIGGTESYGTLAAIIGCRPFPQF